MLDGTLEPSARLAVKHTTRSVRVLVDELVSVVDIHELSDLTAPDRLELNDIGVVRLRLSEPLAVDPYAENRETGAFILIDEASNDTVGAGTVLSIEQLHEVMDTHDRREEREIYPRLDSAIIAPRDREKLVDPLQNV